MPPRVILFRGEVSEWLMVPLSKSGVRKHRGFESRPLRHKPRVILGPAGPPAGPGMFGERSPSGLWRRTGNAVWGNPSRVRIPPSPPLSAPRVDRPMRALAPSVLAHIPSGTLTPVLGRRLRLDRPPASRRLAPCHARPWRWAEGRGMGDRLKP